MAPYYKHLCVKYPQYFQLDEALLEQMEESNAKTLADIDLAQEEAEKDSGGELLKFYNVIDSKTIIP